MTKKELLKILKKLPDDAEIYVRHGSAYDDAYPAKARFFGVDGDGATVLYLQVDHDKLDYHRNFPEGYSGVKEKKI